MLGAEESEMPELGCAHIRRRYGEDFRFDRSKTRAQKLDGRPRGPGIVGKTDRAHRAPVLRKIRQALERGVVEEIARAVDPVGPLQKDALRQVLAYTAPSGMPS